MQLSKRLTAVADLLGEGHCLADVGTDHGYLPIHLIQSEKIERAIALDVRTGPLERAKEHIAQQGLENRIETRLSDGVEALQPGEADCMAAAGMGGSLIIHILQKGSRVIDSMKACILQPQSEIARVRDYLWAHGYRIEAEELVLEDGKYYPMMRVVPGGSQKIEDETYEVCAKYGPCLLSSRHPLLKKLVEKEYLQNAVLIEQLEGQPHPPQKRLEELYTERRLIGQAREWLVR